MLDTCCYSPQEQILLAGTKGKTNPHRNTHKRLFEILEGFDGMPPIIDIERARLGRDRKCDGGQEKRRKTGQRRAQPELTAEGAL